MNTEIGYDMTRMAELDDAIAAVMAEIKRLEKSETNSFAGYSFTPVDNFKDHYRPLLARQGITPVCDENSVDLFDLTTLDKQGKERRTTAFKVEYSISMRRKGVQTNPEKITVILPYTGAQTTGAARSYAIKEWFKIKVLASSGDVDAEAAIMEQSEYSGAALPKAKARDLFSELQEEMRSASTARDPESFKKWAEENSEKLKLLPPDWQAMMRKEYLETMEAMNALEDVDRDQMNGGENEQRQ